MEVGRAVTTTARPPMSPCTPNATASHLILILITRYISHPVEHHLERRPPLCRVDGRQGGLRERLHQPSRQVDRHDGAVELPQHVVELAGLDALEALHRAASLERLPQVVHAHCCWSAPKTAGSCGAAQRSARCVSTLTPLAFSLTQAAASAPPHPHMCNCSDTTFTSSSTCPRHAQHVREEDAGDDEGPRSSSAVVSEIVCRAFARTIPSD